MQRRAFLRRSVVGGAGLWLAACGDDGNDGPEDPTSNRSATEGDIATLNFVLELEHEAVAAYTAVAARLDMAKVFAEQEREHAGALVDAIKDLGGKPSKAEVADDYGFPQLDAEEDVLKFALDLENTTVAAYIDALPKLSSPDLRGTAASIVTNEAEHLSVLLGALGEAQAPDPFVTGTPA